jgi:hypothetical protein
MKASDAAISALCESLASEGTPTDKDFEVALGEAIGKLRWRAHRANAAARARQVVTECEGRVTDAAERLGVTPRAVYYHLENKLKSPA